MQRREDAARGGVIFRGKLQTQRAADNIAAVQHIRRAKIERILRRCRKNVVQLHQQPFGVVIRRERHCLAAFMDDLQLLLHQPQLHELGGVLQHRVLLR